MISKNHRHMRNYRILGNRQIGPNRMDLPTLTAMVMNSLYFFRAETGLDIIVKEGDDIFLAVDDQGHDVGFLIKTGDAVVAIYVCHALRRMGIGTALHNEAQQLFPERQPIRYRYNMNNPGAVEFLDTLGDTMETKVNYEKTVSGGIAPVTDRRILRNGKYQKAVKKLAERGYIRWEPLKRGELPSVVLDDSFDIEEIEAVLEVLKHRKSVVDGPTEQLLGVMHEELVKFV